MREPTETYNGLPGYKAQGPSKNAAVAEQSRAETLREKVVERLEHGNFTADEVAGQLNESVLAIRPRFSELVKAVRIADTGSRRKNASGHSATVWELVGTTRVQTDLFGV